jgi:internalin A
MFHQYASKISELGLIGITLIKLSRVVNPKSESMEASSGLPKYCFPESGWWGRILSAMKVLIPILIGLLVVGCGKEQSTNTTEGNNTATTSVPLESTNSTDESSNSEKQKIYNTIRKKLDKLDEALTNDDLLSVKELNLNHIGINDFTILQELTNLTHLHLWVDGDENFAPLRKLPNLTHLLLWGIKIIDLTTLEEIPNLRYLGLRDMQIKDLPPLAKLPSLYTLSLSEVHNADLDRNSLLLRDNKIPDLISLAGVTNLKHLILQGNKITNLKPLEKLINLTELNLSYNKITDLTSLERLTKLEELWLSGNPNLTKAQITELQKALPNCKIKHNAKK